jgi:hypothetical protein
VTGDEAPKLAIFELATAEKVTDRRAEANTWTLSVNSAIVGLYGYLQADKIAVGTSQNAVWRWAIPAAGAVVCLAWNALLTSYANPTGPNALCAQSSKRIFRFHRSPANAKSTPAIADDRFHTLNN